jgi:CelD/BcsL family acetyltransferase involved in cellulose biosynthesis
MTWTLYPIAQLANFANQWDTLAQSRPDAPFLETAFLQAAIDTFGSGDELLCLNHANGQLRGAAIVQRCPKGMWQTFQPSQLPLGAWLSNEDVELVSTGNALLSKLPGLALGLGITQLDSRFQARPEDGPAVRTQNYIQTAWVDIEGDFNAYWEARGKNLKQNTRKQRNKLQAEGSTTRLECITAAADVPKAIEDYGLLESAGWKTADGTAIHPGNAQGQFYRKMLENFCRLGRGRIYRYWFGDKVVAMDLCICDNTTIVILKTTYDESYKQVSPSTLMRQDEFQQLFDEAKFQRIEFYGKVMEWHTRWTLNARAVYHANVYRHALVLRLLNLRDSIMRKKAAQPTPEEEATHA